MVSVIPPERAGASSPASALRDRSSRITGARPRVAMVTARFPPYTGGIETHVYEVARRMADEGIDATVLTTDPSRSLPAAELVDGISVRRFPAWPAQRDYYAAPALFAAVRNGGWDAVHCQGVHTLVPPLAMVAARSAGIPFAVTFHTGGHSSRVRHGLRALQWRVLRPLLASAARLIGVSRFEADLFRSVLHLPASRFTVIPNGGRLPEPTAGLAPGTDTHILSVGRLERYKGHQRAIAALPALRALRPDARLTILGTGPFEAELRAQAVRLGLGDAVEIRSIPAADRRAMADALVGASLVVLLSEYEAHPVAVMEAVALRRPVLVADTTGLSELAQRGLAFALPLSAGPDETARAMLTAIERPRTGTAVELPTWDGCAAALADVYRAIARRTRAA